MTAVASGLARRALVPYQHGSLRSLRLDVFDYSMDTG